MKVKVTCHGPIDIELSDPNGYIDVPDHSTVKQALKTLPLDKGMRKYLPVMINGKAADRSDHLQDGDELGIVIPALGG